jgi:hypothetical protein
MLAKIPLSLLRNPLLAAGLAQALGSAAVIIQTIGLVAVFAGLIGAAVLALSPEVSLRRKDRPGVLSAKPVTLTV